jgi:hypothetical protein
MIAFDQERPRRGRLFGGFEHHRIPGEERGHDMAIGQVRREIIRPQHRQHPVRPVAQRHAPAARLVGDALARTLGLRGDRDGDLGDHGVDLGRRLHSGLPVSRAISSAKDAARSRTSSAKRRSVAIRSASGVAAQPGHPARAAATSRVASPIGSWAISAPVAAHGSTGTGSWRRG